MTRIERLAPANAKWVATLIIGCVAVGLLSGVNPAYGIAAAVGVVFAACAISNLTVGVVVFACLSFLQVLNSNSNTATSFTKVVGLLLFGSWYASTLTATPPGARISNRTSPMFLIAGVSLLAWSTLSIAWAASTGAVATSASRYLLNMLLFPIVLAAVRRREHLLWVLTAFVLGAVVSTVYGFAIPSTSQAGRLSGGIGDANEQAAVLVAAIPMAIGLAVAMRRRLGLRIIAWTSAVVCLAGVVNTLSRGGLIALGVMMLAGVVFGGRWRPWATALLLATTVSTVAYFVVIAPLGARARVTNGDTSGRSDLWTIGWRMVQAHPLTGVGSGNFPVSSIHYLQRPGAIRNANLIVDVPHVAHNIYLELLAELGIPGLVAFLGIVAASLGAALRAAFEFRRTGHQELELIARCVVVGLVGFLAADFFLSGEYSKQLWLVLALCPALLGVARSPIATAVAGSRP